MNERPPIPASLRRRVLVEAGHRCSIHTCRHPDVDIHHIVPWDQCHSHDYDNLIALCPNCHRRADAGEIDRISLRLYKAHTVAAFGIGAQPPMDAIGPSRLSSWEKTTIRELHDTYPPYEVALEYPQFNGVKPGFSELNVMLRSDALNLLFDMRALKLSAEPEEAAWWGKVPSQLTSSFEVSCCTDRLVSIRHSVFHYGAGAAHPNHWTSVTNAQMGPLVPLSFGQLFDFHTPYLKIISDHCISELTKEKGLIEASDWIVRGAGPDLKNYSKFNITPNGLLISFGEYQVDCYAAGPSQVLIKPCLIKEYLNPRCSVAGFWTA